MERGTRSVYVQKFFTMPTKMLNHMPNRVWKLKGLASYQSHAPPTPYRAYVGDWVGIPLRKAPHMMGLQLALDSMGSKVKASPQFSRPCGYILDSSVARSLYPYTDHLGKRRVAAS